MLVIKDLLLVVKDFCWSKDVFLSTILNYKHLLVIKDFCVSFRICSCHGGGRRPCTKTTFYKQLNKLRICQHEKQLFLHSSPLGLKFEVYKRLRVSSVCHLREFSPPLLLVCALRFPFPLCMPLLVKYMDVCVCVFSVCHLRDFSPPLLLVCALCFCVCPLSCN